MGPRPPRSRRLIPVAGFTGLIGAVIALALLGDEPVETDVGPLGSVAVVPEVSSAVTEPVVASEIDSTWCVALLDLDRADGPVGAELAMAYRSIAAGSPAALAADLLGAADLIEAGDDAADSTTSIIAGDPSSTLPEDFDAEGRPLEDDPRLRVAVYVETVCRATGSNPGPPATQPSLAVDETQSGAP